MNEVSKTFIPDKLESFNLVCSQESPKISKPEDTCSVGCGVQIGGSTCKS